MGSYTGQAVFGGTTDPVTGSWTNATSLNATVVSSDITGYGVVVASFSISGTVTQGTAIFEVSDDAGTTWWPIAGLQTGNNAQSTSASLTGGSVSYEFATGAYNLFRARLNPVVLGSGTVNIRISAEAFPFMTTVAVSGTTNVSITGTNAVTQSGTWTVQQGGAPWSQNLTQLNSVALGSPSNFGTSPGAVAVAGHNASIFAGTTALTATGSSLNVNITGGSTSGTQYTGSPAVSAAAIVTTAASGYDGANVRPLLTSTTGQLHVIADSGSTTVVTGTVAVTQSTSPWVVSLTSTTITGTVAVTQSTTPWTIQGDSASGAAKAGNPVQMGGVFNTTQPTVTTGQTVEAQATARGALIVATGIDAFAVNASQTGTWNIGTVTSITNTVTVSGTVTANQGGAPWSQNLTQVAGTTLGATAVTNFGTAPAAAAVPGVNASVFAGTTGITATGSSLNANVTNTVTVTGTVTVSGTVAATQSGTWTVQPGNTANTTPWLFTVNQGGNSATVSAGGALKVDGSAATQPVSGTVAATQSGTWTVQPGNTANTTAWLVTGTGGTFPVTGTVAATQSGTWNVGTVTTVTTLSQFPTAAASADALANPTITQVGVEGMGFNGTTWDRLRTAGAGNNIAATGILATAEYGQFNTTLPTLTNGNYGVMQLDSSGRQLVAQNDTTVASTALGALNAAISVALVGQTSVGFQLAAGTLIGTIIPEISFDGGTTWIATQFIDPLRSSYFNQYVFAASNTATGAGIDTSGGATNARVRVSAFTSGTANAVMNACKVSRGSVTATMIDGQKITYRAAIGGTTAIAQGTASPVMSIVGSSTKIVRVTRIRYGGWSAATGANVTAFLRRYSALSGGTSVTMTAGKFDTQDPNATAVASNWTAAATTATVVAILSSDGFSIPSTGVTQIDPVVDYQFGVAPGSKELVLRGTSDFLGIAFSAVGTTPTALASGWIEWTEE